MNKNIAIRAIDISKQYRLGEVGTGTLSHDLNRAWAKLRGKEDPFLKVGESNDRSSKGNSDYVWSLKDINFEIEKGDAVGIIGRNGAGKSTLLKLLSRVTKPTTGHFEVNGRIASLLEVGTGFNPEMTGRENIFLNGAILGMRRHEIKRKFDEIVDFAGVERYIDTPVKRYSSGMYVRLAFAVAAHLESEILIVDEVLAVGDAEFQKKCLGKMGDVSKGEGRTVLFVSHNMAAVQNLCNKGLLMENGRLEFEGNVFDVVEQYFKFDLKSESYHNADLKMNELNIKTLKVYGETEYRKPQTGDSLHFYVEFSNPNKIAYKNIILDLIISDGFGNKIMWISTYLKPCTHNTVGDVLIFTISKLLLVDGEYSLSFGLSSYGRMNHIGEDVISFVVLNGNYFNNSRNIPKSEAKVISDFEVEYR